MKKAGITYLDKPGPKNTDEVISAVKSYLERDGLKHVVVASSTGATGVKFADAIGEMANLTVVTYHTGFNKEGVQNLEENNRGILESKGIKIVTQSHVFSGIERSISKKFGGISRVETIAEALRSLFGHGLKVCIEVTIMAADSGAIPIEDVIAVGGTGNGADTAILIRPAHMNNFFDAKIREFIIIPRER
ncbi:MAG: hypothetical protein WCE81_01880 [Halobacteriota archaeon]